jgi:histidinol dehydrogenase
LCDRSADAGAVARELAAQAEHDPRAVPVAVCQGEDVAKRVQGALTEAIGELPRRDVVEQALQAHGAVLEADDREEAVAFLDRMAPEHCAILHEDDEAIAGQLEGPACIVAGSWPRIPFTDYAAGPSHVLPTGGHARAAGGISTRTFTKQVHEAHLDDVDPDLREAAIELARLEGFEAHARALEEGP